MIAHAGTEIEIDSPRDFETEAWRTDVRAAEVGRAVDHAPPPPPPLDVEALLVASMCGSCE